MMLFVDCPRPVYMYVREIGSMTAEYVHNNIISSYLQQSRERERNHVEPYEYHVIRNLYWTFQIIC